MGDVALPFAGAVPVVIAADVEIRLDQHGGRGGCGCRRWPEKRRQIPAVISRTPRCAKSAGARSRGGLRSTTAAAGHERIDRNQHEADAVDAGPGSQLVHKRVIDLRVAQLIPGNTGDAGRCQFQRDPEERCGQPGQPRLPVRLPDQHHAQAEQCRSRGREPD